MSARLLEVDERVGPHASIVETMGVSSPILGGLEHPQKFH